MSLSSWFASTSTAASLINSPRRKASAATPACSRALSAMRPIGVEVAWAEVDEEAPLPAVVFPSPCGWAPPSFSKSCGVDILRTLLFHHQSSPATERLCVFPCGVKLNSSTPISTQRGAKGCRKPHKDAIEYPTSALQ